MKTALSAILAAAALSEDDVLAIIGVLVVLAGILLIVGIILIIRSITRNRRENARSARDEAALRRRKEALTHGQRVADPTYGFSPYNPIVMSPGVNLPQYGLYGKEIEAYLASLRSRGGKPLAFKKSGTARLKKLYGQKNVRVDRYRMYIYINGRRKRYCTLYVCPEGFRLENPPIPKGLRRAGQQGTVKGPGSATEAETRTYYALLGVSRTATREEINAAYKQLARKYHPDISSEPDAAEIMKQINIARDVLTDPARRADYDLKLRRSGS